MPKSVPDEYSYPSRNPKMVCVTDSLYNRVKKGKYGLRLWQSEERELETSKDLVSRL